MNTLTVKVCGISDPGNMSEIAGLGIDWIGWIFHPASPRNAEPHLTSLSTANRNDKKIVGVFVHQKPGEILRITADHSLDMVQLHGDQSPEDCRHIADDFPVIKVFRISSEKDFQATHAFRSASCFLFDTRAALYGGSGRKFDWGLLRHYRGDIPFILSGGIRPDDVQDLMRIDHPAFAGIDLNSGFEIRPGFKDVQVINKFLIQLNDSR